MQRCLPQDPHWNLHQEAGYVSCQKRWLWPWAPGIVQGGPHQQHPSSHTSWHSWAAGCSPVKMIYGELNLLGMLKQLANSGQVRILFSAATAALHLARGYINQRSCVVTSIVEMYIRIYIYIYIHIIYIHIWSQFQQKQIDKFYICIRAIINASLLNLQG